MRIGTSRFFFFQAEDGIRDLVRSRGLGDVYKRQVHHQFFGCADLVERAVLHDRDAVAEADGLGEVVSCLLYTSDAADERSSVDLGGRRIIKKKNKRNTRDGQKIEEYTNRQQHTKTSLPIYQRETSDI